MPKKKIENAETVETLILLGLIFCVTGIAIPVGNLILRILNHKLLLDITPGHIITMNPLASVTMILLGVAIFIIRKEKPDKINARIAMILCILVGVTCIVKIFSIIFRFEFYLDEILFRDQLVLPEGIKWDQKLNSLAPYTATGILFLSVSILISLSRFKYKYSQFLNYITFLMSLLSCYGYVYLLKDKETPFHLISMAFYSALTLILLSLSVLFLRPHRGTMKYLIGQNTSQIVLLRFMAFFIPLIIEFIKRTGENQGWYESNYGTAFFAACTFIISMSLIGYKSNVQLKLRKKKSEYKQRIIDEQKLLKRIIDESPLWISIYNLLKQRFIYLNKSNRDHIPLSRKYHTSESYIEALYSTMHPNDVDYVRDKNEKYKEYSLNDTDSFIYRVYDKTNKILWIYSKAIVYKLKKGKAKEILFNSYDITNRQEYKKKLKNINREIQDQNDELESINKVIENYSVELEEQVKERSKEIEDNEKSYEVFLENSLDGIILYRFKNKEGIPTDIPLEEQVQEVFDNCYIEYANEKLAKIHGYESGDEMKGIWLRDYLKMDEEKIKVAVKKFLGSGYRIEGLETVHAKKDGKALKIRSNLIGEVEDKLFKSAWGTQTFYE